MRYLTIVNGALFALFAALALVMGVVCILYLPYLETTPRLQSEWPSVLTTTAVFTLLTVSTGFGFYGLLRARSWRWIAQLLLLLTVVPGLLLLGRLYT